MFINKINGREYVWSCQWSYCLIALFCLLIQILGTIKQVSQPYYPMCGGKWEKATQHYGLHWLSRLLTNNYLVATCTYFHISVSWWNSVWWKASNLLGKQEECISDIHDIHNEYVIWCSHLGYLHAHLTRVQCCGCIKKFHPRLPIVSGVRPYLSKVWEGLACAWD
jgi:hypothetical protein